MRIKSLFIGLFSLLALGSCSKDFEPELPGQSVGTQTEQIDISLGTEQDDEGLRAIYNLASDGSITGLDRISTSDKLRIRVYIRRYNAHGDITGRSTSDLVFTKEPGRNYANYTGKLEVPARTATSDTYKIAAALLGEGENPAPGPWNVTGTPGDFLKDRYPSRLGKIDHMLEVAGSLPVSSVVVASDVSGIRKLTATIPYLTSWQDFPRSTSSTRTQVTLKFKALGTILRFRIKNNTTENMYLYSCSFRSTAFATSPVVDFFDENGVKPKVEDLIDGPWLVNRGYIDRHHSNWGSYQEQIPMVPDPTYGGSPSFHFIASGQYSAWHYLLAYPLPKSSGEPVFTSVTLKAHLYSGTTWLNTVHSETAFYFNSKELSDASSVPFTVEYNGPDTRYDYLKVRPAPGSASRPAKLPLDYVAEYNMNQAGTGFANSTGAFASNGGTFSYQEAVERFTTPITIAGRKYSLPTRNELASIFPTYDGMEDPLTYSLGGGRYLPTRRPHERIERDVQIGSTIGTYLSVYSAPSDGDAPPPHLYAIRFQDQTDQYRTAFRYTFRGDGVQVDCIWLGANSDRIEDVAQPAFWNSRPYTSRKFPLYGVSYDPMATFKNVGAQGGYWTSSTLGNSLSYAYVVQKDAALMGVPNGMRNAVRLFLRD